MKEKFRVVFDCNTLLQALAVPQGPSGRCVQLALDGGLEAYISLPAIAELLDVAGRPKVIRKLHLKQNRIDEFVHAIQRHATLLAGFAEPFTLARDPDDSFYINLAIAARAQFLVTRDEDLLSLMDTSTVEGSSFRSRFSGLAIVTPVQLLGELDGTS